MAESVNSLDTYIVDYFKNNMSQFLLTEEQVNDKLYASLYNNLSNERKSPSIPGDTLSEDRQTPFNSSEIMGESSKSALVIKNPNDNEEKSIELPSYTLPKTKDDILAELQRDALSYMMTINEIAEKYNISYMNALDIYKSLNEDASGVVREFNLPENSTISFLV